MIFLTVGTQLPFDRLVKSVDRWAAEHPGVPVFAQIGKGAHKPENIVYRESLTPAEFEEKCRESAVIVGHVGMGTIITGMSMNKSMILMPRLHELGEHRNDHQVSSAKRFEQLESVTIVYDFAEMSRALDQRLDTIASSDHCMSPQVSASLIQTIEDFIHDR